MPPDYKPEPVVPKIKLVIEIEASYNADRSLGDVCDAIKTLCESRGQTASDSRARGILRHVQLRISEVNAEEQI